MQHKVRLLASSALLVAITTFGSTAYAQSKSGTTAAASNTIEELVVTAEKRSQSLQDIPVAISAFTSEKRDLLGIKSIQDLTNFTPGLNYTSANDRASVRGIGRLTNAHPVAVPVAVYDDGIYTTSTTTAGKTPIFTDRIEVLRGPQGTLYGRNSIGGAINVISKRPTEDPYAEVRATVANYSRTVLEAAVSGPLAPDLQYRLAGSWEKQRDGYYHNIVPGMPSEGNVLDQFYVEGQLQAKFGDHADGWIKGFIQGWNNGSGGPGARAGYTNGPVNYSEFGAQNLSAGFACAPGGVVANVVSTSPLGCANPALNGKHRDFATNVAQTVSLDETYGLSANYTYHFDGFDLKYIGGGLNYHYTLVSDNSALGSVTSLQVPLRPAAAGAPAAICSPGLVAAGICKPLTFQAIQSSTYSEDYHNFSHEINVSSSGQGALQWLGGLYYYREGYKQPVFTTEPNNDALDGAVTAAVAPLTGAVGRDFQRRIYDDRPQFNEESYAGFGQIDWKFTDTLKLTVGLRYSHDKLTGTESVRLLCFATAACGTTPELLGSFTPPVDVTAAVVYGPLAGLRGGTTVAPPPGVVNNGKSGGISLSSDGFATRNYDDSWSATTGTVGLQWDPTADTMFYGRYSRGYLMGGFNSGVTSSAGQFPETNPEHINDYELGMKKQFFNRSLQVNLALFYEDLRDFQAPLTVVSNTGALATSQSRYLNIPKSVSQGAELEVNWAPIDHLNVLFNYSYDDAHVKSLSGIVDPSDPEAVASGAKPQSALAACGTAVGVCDVNTGLNQRTQDLSGNSLPQNPKNKVAVAVTYSFETDYGTLIPEVSYIWRDKQYGGLFQRSYNEAPSWDQWDARVTWKGKDNRYSVIAYIKNAFNTLGYDGGSSSQRYSGIYSAATIAAAGLPQGTPGAVPGTFNTVQSNASFNGISTNYNLTPPRTFGVEFQYRF